MRNVVVQAESQTYPRTCLIHSDFGVGVHVGVRYDGAWRCNYVACEIYCELDDIFGIRAHRSQPLDCFACRSVVEYSRVEDGCSIGDGSIVSYMHLTKGTSVPADVVIQTVPLLNGFVTFAFGLLSYWGS